MKTPEYFRLRAEELRATADKMRHAPTRACMKRIACDYDRLAANGEDQEAHDTLMMRLAADYDHMLATIAKIGPPIAEDGFEYYINKGGSQTGNYDEPR